MQRPIRSIASTTLTPGSAMPASSPSSSVAAADSASRAAAISPSWSVGSGGNDGRTWPRERSSSCNDWIPFRSAAGVYAAIRSTPPGSLRARSSSASSNAASPIRAASGSSSTTNSGSSPAASACARSTRAQNPWMVEMNAASVARAASWAPSARKRARMRSRISAAAFSVNVIVRIASTATPSSSTERTKRSTRTDVLPLPAAASSNRSPSRRSIA